MARWPELDGLLHLGLSARSVEGCFEAMDIDGDGNITVCLFPCVMFDDLRYLYFHSQPQRMMLLLTLAHVLVGAASHTGARAGAAVHQMEEFTIFCEKSADSPEAIFASIDADGDGQLSLVSFRLLHRSLLIHISCLILTMQSCVHPCFGCCLGFSRL